LGDLTAREALIWTVPREEEPKLKEKKRRDQKRAPVGGDLEWSWGAVVFVVGEWGNHNLGIETKK